MVPSKTARLRSALRRRRIASPFSARLALWMASRSRGAAQLADKSSRWSLRFSTFMAWLMLLSRYQNLHEHSDRCSRWRGVAPPGRPAIVSSCRRPSWRRPCGQAPRASWPVRHRRSRRRRAPGAVPGALGGPRVYRASLGLLGLNAERPSRGRCACWKRALALALVLASIILVPVGIGRRSASPSGQRPGRAASLQGSSRLAYRPAPTARNCSSPGRGQLASDGGQNGGYPVGATKADAGTLGTDRHPVAGTETSAGVPGSNPFRAKWLRVAAQPVHETGDRKIGRRAAYAAWMFDAASLPRSVTTLSLTFWPSTRNACRPARARSRGRTHRRRR